MFGVLEVSGSGDLSPRPWAARRMGLRGTGCDHTIDMKHMAAQVTRGAGRVRIKSVIRLRIQVQKAFFGGP